MAALDWFKDAEMVVKLGDFGCARDMNSLEFKNADYDGSYLYQSPEMIFQESPEASVGGDIWAVGCLIFVVACRKEPYHWIKNKWNIPFQIGASVAPHSSEDVWPEDVIRSVAQSCWAISEARPTAGQLIQRMLQFPQLVASSFESHEPADGDLQRTQEINPDWWGFSVTTSAMFLCHTSGCESLGFTTKERYDRHANLHWRFSFQMYREWRQISGIMGALEHYLFSRVSTVLKRNVHKDIPFNATVANSGGSHQPNFPPPLVLYEQTSNKNYLPSEPIIENPEPRSLSGRSYTRLQLGTYRGHKVVIKSFQRLLEQTNEQDSERHFAYDLRNSKIQHRYLLRLHGLCYINDIAGLLTPAAVIPYYPNGDLLQYRGCLDYLGQLKMLMEILEGLRAMHAHDPPLVHKCLKASNILIDEYGSPQINLISFEHFVMMTQEPAPSASYSENWQVVSRWWSPEVYSDVHEFGVVDVDIWAFGCVALEVLTGEMPYGPYDTGPELVRQILSGTPPDIGLSTTPPATVWQDVRRCWIPMDDPSEEPPVGPQSPRPRSEELINMFWGHIMRESFNSLIDLTDQVTREPIPISTGHSSNLYLGTLKDSLNTQEKTVTVEEVSSTPYYHTRDKDLLESVTRCTRQRARLNHPKMCKQFGLIYPPHFSMPEIRPGRDAYDVGRNSLFSRYHAFKKALNGPQYPSLVMEHCSGGLLMEYLSRYHLRLDQKICLIRDILDLLDYLHEQEMIWGNLHPSSVFVDEHGGAKLGGLSNCLISPVRVRVKASITYMRYLSPEQMQEESQAHTAAMDIWAAGCVAMQILTGLEPFEKLKSQYDIDQGVRTGIPPFEPNGHFEGYRDLYPILAMCWSVDPSQRPSAAALLESLKAL